MYAHHMHTRGTVVGMPTPITYVARDGTVTYRVRVRVGGRQTSETFPNRQAANAFAAMAASVGPGAAVAARSRLDHASDGYVPTLAEWLPRHIDQLTGVTDRTRLDYAAIGRRTFLSTLGKYPVDAIDRTMVAQWLNSLSRHGLSAKTISNAHGLLSSVMASAVTAGLITANPCHRMRLPRDAVRETKRYLTHDEYARLYEATPERDKPLVMTLFGTGARWSEVTALQVRDVHLDGPLATVSITKAWKRTPGRPPEIGPPKSPRSCRTIVLPQQLAGALAPLTQRPGTDLLFTAARGGMVHHGPWRSRVWAPSVKATGIVPPPRIHDARHTHASWLIEQGATLEMVQDQLGHESILVTRQVYAHLQPAMRMALAEAATRALSAQPALPRLSP